LDEFDPRVDYPLGTRRPDLVRTPSGLAIEELTLEALRAGRLVADDMRATTETLRRQADVARAAGRAQLAENLSRAAELTAVPDDVVLAIYSALRPRRSTAGQLEAWAGRLERDFGAPAVATFVREAGAAYAARGLLAIEGRPA
jgi:propanediol dehydratase small subunit